MRRLAIWSLFLVSLTLATIALALVSREALEADADRETLLQKTRQAQQAESLAAIAIEQRDRIGRAVWRLDTMLTPLVAQESTRPADLYLPLTSEEISKDEASQATQSNSGYSRSSRSVPQAAPASDNPIETSLVTVPNEYVALHFQVDSAGVWTSPQVPINPNAVSDWIPAEEIAARRALLEALAKEIAVTELQRLVPDQQIRMASDNLYAVNSLEYNGISSDANVGDASAYRQDSLRQMASQRPESSEPTASGEQAFRDWDLRNRLFENFANTSFRTQRLVVNQNRTASADEVTEEGVTRPIWMGDRLILARRWRSPICGVVIQGCCLDWPKLKERLQSDIQDLLPQCDLVPVRPDSQLEPTQLLATLPVQVVVPPPALPEMVSVDESGTSRVVWMLGAAWFGLVLAGLAGAVVIFQTESLASRRAQFVSSVTHELRTPLTTFRMYTEMLDSGMVPPGPAFSEYLATLRREAERLNHLVDNVLAYARLEHGRKRKVRVERDLEQFLAELEPRLTERVKLAGMTFQSVHGVEHGDEFEDLGRVQMDPLSIEQILFNLVDNACKYANVGKTPVVELHAVRSGNVWRVSVLDRGPGVQGEARAKLFRYFSKTDHEAAVTAPGIGLGLALSRRIARDLGGKLEYRDREGGGAEFVLELPA